MPTKIYRYKRTVVVNVYTVTIINNMTQVKDTSLFLEEAQERNKKAIKKLGTELRKEQEKKSLAEWKKNNSQKLSATLSKLNTKDKAVCEGFQKLSNTCGGDRKLCELLNIYLATKSRVIAAI